MSHIDDIITHLQDALFYLDHANTVDPSPDPHPEVNLGTPISKAIANTYLEAAKLALDAAEAALDAALRPT